MEVRFVDNGDGTITDRTTGLSWEIKTARNVNDLYSWEEAHQYIETILNCNSFGGFGDWRLPSVQELISIVDYNRRNLEDYPSIDLIFGPTMSDWYW